MFSCNIDQDLSEGQKWNLGVCESGFPLSADRGGFVLGLAVFARPHDPGASPGEAVTSPWRSALCNRVHRGRDLHR